VCAQAEYEEIALDQDDMYEELDGVLTNDYLDVHDDTSDEEN
jgi:hypothetical protein